MGVIVKGHGRNFQSAIGINFLPEAAMRSVQTVYEFVYLFKLESR